MIKSAVFLLKTNGYHSFYRQISQSNSESAKFLE